ncbi:maltokinase N-terminal cap-like domain-containing protein [Crossiella cryophila]|uniref:Maltokinase n=1 Tax=Crossiella cryophila TaxID=43355 RepID=A0A7W7FZ10_9PSEU|nr:aminoglycoside phosphotransferase [Crossiella cryophila]MBB4682238.1 maltokinase [Crossiella cryophila]
MTSVRLDLTDLPEALTGALPDWLPGQRWFAGKDRPVLGVRTRRLTVLRAADPALVLAVVEVDQGGEPERYQLLLGARPELPDWLETHRICDSSGWGCYDAAHDPELAGELLGLIAADREVEDLRFTPEPGVELSTGLRGRPVGVEQSNTSLVYGSQYILKLFRKLVPGENRDLTLHRVLAAAGCAHIAPPLGSISAPDGTLGMLQSFVEGAADGWAMATASVRDLMAEADLHADEVGGDFAGEARRLGHAVAEVHADLRRAAETRLATPGELTALVAAMHRRLDGMLESVPELAEHAEALRKAFDAAVAAGEPIEVQHVHADLHLGQCLRTPTGWVLIDFEGEPAAPAAERARLRSPLRDVAGMLRSFDYAAHQRLVGHSDDHQLTVRALEWAQRNRTAFCAGYAEVAGDPREHAELLRALELDKAVYEVAYEHANRPEWLPIPLSSIARITSGEEPS